MASRWSVLCVAIVGICATISPGVVHAENRPLVYKGKEILVFRKAKNTSGENTNFTFETPVTNGSAVKSISQNQKYMVIGSAPKSGEITPLSTEPKIQKHIRPQTLARLCRPFRRLKDVGCEANSLFFAKATPNDARFSDTWGMTTIGAQSAWDVTTGSSDVLVAVVDTGIDYYHQDLTSNIARNNGETPNNGIDDDLNGFTDDYIGWNFVDSTNNPMDDNEHGTHCAGTIGGVGNNGTGVAGVNWSVGLLPVKVLDGNGSGTLYDVALGIDYAVSRGVTVISMSLGGSSSSAALKQSVEAADAAGILIAAAAGNEGSNNDQVSSYPANYSTANIIAVAATDENDELAYFSNYGARKVDLAAPGVNILSAEPGNLYQYLDGTSMATPHVAGAVALVKAANPSLTGAQIKSIILNTATRIDGLCGKMVTGGRLHVGNAVAVASGQMTDPGESSCSGESTGAYEFEMNSPLYSRTAAWVSGFVTSIGEPVSTRVSIVCDGRVLKRATSNQNEDGSFTARITRPSRGYSFRRCYARTGTGAEMSTSSTFRVRSQR